MRLGHWIYTIPLRLRSLFRRKRVEEELDEEFRYHLEQQIEEHLAGGLDPREARLAALGALDGIELRKEECRDMRRINLFEDLLRDLGFGLRMFRKNPGFTAVAVLTLALGIGANTAIFSVVDGVLLRPLPFPDPDRLVSVQEMDLRNEPTPDTVSYPNFFDWRSENSVFDRIAAYRSKTFTLTGVDNPDRLIGAIVSSDLFPLLGVSDRSYRLFRSIPAPGGGARAWARLLAGRGEGGSAGGCLGIFAVAIPFRFGPESDRASDHSEQ